MTDRCCTDHRHSKRPVQQPQAPRRQDVDDLSAAESYPALQDDSRRTLLSRRRSSDVKEGERKKKNKNDVKI